MRVTPNLTQAYGEMLERQIRATRAGQAHFAGSGPPGAACGECEHLGYYRHTRNMSGDTVKTAHYGGCAKYRQLTGKHGAIVPPNTPACRHFERKGNRS